MRIWILKVRIDVELENRNSDHLIAIDRDDRDGSGRCGDGKKLSGEVAEEVCEEDIVGHVAGRSTKDLREEGPADPGLLHPLLRAVTAL